MRRDEIVVGNEYTVDPRQSEMHMGYGSGDPRVRVTVIETGFDSRERGMHGGQHGTLDGVLCRIEEDFRREQSLGSGKSKVNHWRVGYEFVIQTKDVLWPWGRNPNGVQRTDDDRSRIRAQRYAEQDTIAEVCEQLGIVPTMQNDIVKFNREQLAAWLARLDEMELLSVAAAGRS